MITLYTVEQVAEMFHRPTEFVADLARDNKLPGRKVGRRWMFTESDVQTYLDSVATSAAKPRTINRRRRAA